MKLYKNKTGFTLIEILITVAILAIMSSLTIMNLVSFRNKTFFDTDANIIEYVLQNAQNRAILGDSGASWGVQFTNTTSTGYLMKIFSGTSYSSSTVVLVESLSQASEFADPARGFSKTVVFNQLTGTPVTPNEVVIKRVRHDNDYVISVSSIGNISKRLEKGLVGFWPFDEGSGTVAYDASYGDNNGTLIGPPTYTNGKSGKALTFNGTSDYVDVGNNASLSITPEFTLAAWVKLAPNTAGLRLGILSKQRSSPHDGYSLARETNNEFVFWTMNNDSTVAVFSDTTYTDALWHYVVAVRQNGINYLYIDGVRQGATTTLAPNEVGLNVQIGTFYQGSNLFDGLIDDVRIYNRALTASEIKEIYENY